MKDAVITIKVSQDQKEILKQIALEEDVSVSQFIRGLVKDYLKNRAEGSAPQALKERGE